MDLTQENMDKMVADNATLTASATKTATDIQGFQDSITALEENARKLKQEKAEAKTAAENAAHEAAQKGGNAEALEASWQLKYDTDIGVRDETIGGLNGMIGNMTAGAAALTMANTLAVEGQAEGLLPHIKSRLTTEIKDGKPVVRVLDKSGKPSALTLEDLQNEISDTGYLATMISGSKANGSGKPGEKGKGNVKTVKRADYDTMSPAEQAKTGIAAGKGEVKIID